VALEASSTALEIAKLVLLPAIGFLAGFGAQWLLQARKSRDELLRALAEPRAAALCKLWELTTLPNEIARLTDNAEIPRQARESLDCAIVDCTQSKLERSTCLGRRPRFVSAPR